MNTKSLAEPYANLYELEKALRQKWNEIGDQPIKKAILQCKRHLAAVTDTFLAFLHFDYFDM